MTPITEAIATLHQSQADAVRHLLEQAHRIRQGDPKRRDIFDAVRILRGAR